MEFLAGLDFIESEDAATGLGKPQTPNKIYQMITDKMIKAISSSDGNVKSLGWDKNFFEKGGYLTPLSYATKKPYRGVNILLLKDGDLYQGLENPYFLTAKQIKEAKGTLKKYAEKLRIVYFTRLYKFTPSKAKKEEGFTTYNKQKMLDFLKEKGHNTKHFDFLVRTIPILTSHEVFNGVDVKGIDFELDKLTELEKVKLGFIPPKKERNSDQRIPMAELIIKNFPKNSAKIIEGTYKAYYSSAKDIVKMPKYKSFYSSEQYYSTLFHEMIHSTGHRSRLNRVFGRKFGDKDYAKEELVAEFGAVFLSAQAGILWKTQKSSANYLKNWQLALKFMREDNKLLMRAATQAQKAADYLLQVDDKREPKFYKELKNKIQKLESQKKSAKKRNTKIRTLAKPSINKELPVIKNTNSLAYKRKHLKDRVFQYYTIQDVDLSHFLGKLEIKSKESLVITLAGKRGSSKTHFAFKFINVLAQNYKVGHASMEEHPESSLYWDKADLYFNEKAEQNLSNPDIKTIEQLDTLIKENDVIVIDSFAKLKELDSKFEIDKDLRKKYDGKLFFIIFQQTADGKMRGGAKSGFDGDCIFFTEKTNDYKTNYIYTDKNRYQDTPLDQLKYNIYQGKTEGYIANTLANEVEF